MTDVFNAPIVGAYFLVSSIADAVEPVFGSMTTAAAIVLFTMAVRILLLPLGFAQARAERKRTELLPRLKALQEEHKDDPEQLQRETLDFYRSSGLFTGMLPTIAQIPFFFVMYRLFTMPTIDGRPNDLLTHDVLGIPLGTGIFGLDAFTFEAVVVFGVLLGLITLVGWWTARRQPPGGPGCLRLVHYVTVVIALFVPLAAGIYLLVTTAWTAVQRVILLRDKPETAP